MDILSSFYYKTASENERNLRFWEDYLKSLKELDFKAFSDKLTVPVLVPIGSRILFRGELKHTNEVTVSIGADYFAKCSIAQAEILRQHRIKDAQSKVDMYMKGKEYLENQLSFRKENIYDNVDQEILEEYSEEEDKAWRIKHRENLRQHKKKSKNEEKNEEITDEELWNRLDELELQEELENELLMNDTRDQTSDTFIVKDEDYIPHISKIKNLSSETESGENLRVSKKIISENRLPQPSVTHQTSKLDLLQKVIDRQNKLDDRLQELKHKERNRSKTESDLLSRLDELEQLDELEDEMDRLDDIIEGEEDVESSSTEDDTSSSPAHVIKRGVSFADEDDSETIEIAFKHSEVLPSNDCYNPEKGIQKPSDIYTAHANLFSETTSILKKKKINMVTEADITTQDVPKVTLMQTDEDKVFENVNKTIVVRDVVEKVDQNGNKVENTELRPTSLFKKKRMQKKS